MRNIFSYLSYSPSWLKILFRSKYLTFLFGVYVNLRTLSQGLIYYGQLEEDKEIKKWLPETRGFYLDIGAGYPVRGSNTFHFYKCGWRGIAIEPIRSSAFLYKLFRPRDKVKSCLVGNQTGYSYFYHFDPYEYSTKDPNIASKMFKKRGVKLISVNKKRQIQLSDLDFEFSAMQPTLLSIDAEGSDLDILKGFPWDKCKPRVICVEEWSDRVIPTENVTNFLSEKKFTLVSTLSPSFIFVADEYLKYSSNR